MSQLPDALWLNASLPLQGFDQPLLESLSHHTSIAQWEYSQNPDTSASLAAALAVLHDDLNDYSEPVHLLGHSTGGLLGLLYAHQYPERVRSLTLLSVGVDPAHDWQAQYYAQRRLLSSDQHTILRQMVDYLLGYPPENITESLIEVLEQDLYQSLSPHSLMRSTRLLPVSVDVPLLVCGSADDEIIDPRQLQDWKQHWRHSASRLWICPGGRYFFHCFYPHQVSEHIIQFWTALPSSPRSYGYQHLKEAFAWRTSKY